MKALRAAQTILILGLAVLGGAVATPATAAEGDGEVRVLIASIQPSAPKPGDPLVVQGEVGNDSDKERTATVRLRVNRTPLYNRTEIELLTAGVPGVRDGTPLPDVRLQLGKIAPGARAPFSLTVPVDALGLTDNGVYVIGVEARDGSRQLALQQTFLPWLPQANLYQPTQLAWLWPVAAPPVRDAHGAFVSDPAKETLISRLGPAGTLSALIRDAGQAPVTWAVDPDLLDSAATLSGDNEPGAAWLSQLRSATAAAGSRVAALPYADADLATLTGHKLGSLADEAVRRGWVAAAGHLGRPVDALMALPTDGLADSRTLALLRRAGATRAVLDSRSLALAESLTYTPTGRARVETAAGPVDVLVSDAGLTNALSMPTRTAGSGVLATQRFLAETAMITLERPNQKRTILVAPPHRWEPAPGWAAGLLAALPTAPWVGLVPMQTLVQQPPQPAYAGARPVVTTIEGSDPLSRKTINGVQAIGRDQRLIEGLLAPESPLKTGYDQARLRAVSGAWRTAPKSGQAYLAHLRKQAKEDLGAVRIIGRGLVTLSSNEGAIPVTVANGLSQPVTVRLQVTPRVASRLQVGQSEPLTIAAGRKATVSIPAVASANGISVVDLQLVTSTGRTYGPQLQLRVNATNFGQLGMVIVGVTAGLLVIAAIWTNVRRIRRARRSRLGPYLHGPAADVAARTEPRPDEKIEA